MPATKFRTRVRAQSGFDADELFKANGASDLSACQYRFVALGAVEGEIVGATAGSNPYPIGILQNAPAASGTAVVRVFGKSQLVVPANPCTLRVGDFITSSGCGGAAFAGASGTVFGRIIAGSVASGATGTATILLNAITPSGSLTSAS